MFELDVDESSKKGRSSPRPLSSSNGGKSKELEEWTKYEQVTVEQATALRKETSFIEKVVKTLQISSTDLLNKEKRQVLAACIKVLAIVLAKGKSEQSTQDICCASPLSNLLLILLR